jgi:HSP20 family protein
MAGPAEPVQQLLLVGGMVMSIMRTGGRSLRSELDRLFDDFFGNAAVRGGDGANSGVWSPVVNVREDANNYYVEAELPGLQREDIQVEVENNVLSLKGERRFEKKEDQESYHFVERSYGSFFRSFALPKNVNSEAIGAEYKEGMLHVTLPKREEVKPRQVSIN